MSKPVTDVEKIRRLPYHYIASALCSIFPTLTWGGAIFPLFLDKLNLPKTEIGLILSLFPFAGILAIPAVSFAVRFGVKRTLITFYTLRKLVYALILFTPLVIGRFGQRGGFLFVAGVLGVFAVCRAIAETGSYPWAKESIPDSVRGRATALNTIISTLATAAALAIAAMVLHRNSSVETYMTLTAVGVGFGLLAMLFYPMIPCGAPDPNAESMRSSLRGMRESLRNRQFLIFLGAMAFQVMSLQALSAFVPLFLKEQVGIDDSSVMLTQIGILLGQLMFTLFWGWAVDTYGSRPVLQTGLWMSALLPVMLTFTPRHSIFSPSFAILIAIFQGASTMAVSIGGTQLLFNRMVPMEKRTYYLSIWYAWAGLTGGTAALMSGVVLDFMATMVADPYVPLFVLCLAFLFLAYFLNEKLPHRNEISPGRFVAMLVTGNPLSALGSVFQFSHAEDEGDRISSTQRMGEAGSPFVEPSLIAALSDPSYNVRLEALLSIARMEPSEGLIAAVSEILLRNDTDLSPAAAWVLGRFGDPRAIPALRKGLDSSNPAIRTRSARALGVLDDRESAPAMIAHLRNPERINQRPAYATALGALKAIEILPDVLDALRSTPGADVHVRAEYALAVARLADAEQEFVKLWHEVDENPTTALATHLMDNRKKWKALFAPGTVNSGKVRECAHLFSAGNMDAGARALAGMLTSAPAGLEPHCRRIIRDCGEMLSAQTPSRREYIILALAIVQAQAGSTPGPASAGEA